MENKENLKNWNKPVSDEVKENVVQIAAERMDVDVTEILDITGMTPADIIDTLFAKVEDGQLYNPEYEFHLVNEVTEVNARLGAKEYKYGELDATSDTLAIDSENTIEDFNGEYTPEYAELYGINQPFHKKVKLPELVLSNAWLAAEKMVEFVQLQTESAKYALAKRHENFLWNKVFAEATEIESDGDVMNINRKMYNQMMNYTTTSDKHVGIGVNGVITIATPAGNLTTQPDLKFEASDFILFVDTDQYTDTVFDGQAVWYNFAATSIKWAKVIPLSFSQYSGFNAIKDPEGNVIAPAVTLPTTGVAMLALHKEAIQKLVKFDYTESLKGRGPWTILHRHEEFDAYRVKTKPIIFIGATAPEAKKAPEESESK